MEGVYQNLINLWLHAQLCKLHQSFLSLLSLLLWEEEEGLHIDRAAVESVLTFSIFLRYGNMTTHEKMLLERVVRTVNIHYIHSWHHNGHDSTEIIYWLISFCKCLFQKASLGGKHCCQLKTNSWTYCYLLLKLYVQIKDAFLTLLFIIGKSCLENVLRRGGSHINSDQD